LENRALREIHRPRAIEDRGMRRTSGFEREELRREWKKCVKKSFVSCNPEKLLYR
jgi:hypothetical protein